MAKNDNNRWQPVDKCGYYIAIGQGYCGEDLIPCAAKRADFQRNGMRCWQRPESVPGPLRQDIVKLREMSWHAFRQHLKEK